MADSTAVALLMVVSLGATASGWSLSRDDARADLPRSAYDNPLAWDEHKLKRSLFYDQFYGYGGYGGGGSDDYERAALDLTDAYARAAGEQGVPNVEHLIAAISNMQFSPLSAREEGDHGAASPPPRRKHASYCNPPNPCPKGKTAAADRCQEGVPDTEEFNRMYILRQMELGMCACDTEHNEATSCPTSPGYTVLPGAQKIDWTRIDALLNDKDSSAPGEVSMQKIAAELGEEKKREGAARGSSAEVISSQEELRSHNPYFDGEELARAAKKSPLML